MMIRSIGFSVLARWRSAGAVASVVLITVAVVSTGCSSGQPKPPNATSGPPATTSTGPAPTSTGPNAERTVADVSYQAGTVQPPDTVLRVAVGQPVKINVRSDRSDDITVDGYPDSNADVDSTEPEDIDFTPTRSGTVTVRLRGAGVTLATVQVS